jgi:preprotein translocase subunit SecG
LLLRLVRIVAVIAVFFIAAAVIVSVVRSDKKTS